MSQRPILTIAAAAATLLLLGVWFGGALWPITAYAGLLGVAAAVWISAVWHRGATAVRKPLPDEVEIGSTIDVVVEVTNRSLLPIAWLLAEDLLPRSAVTPPAAIEIEGSRIAVFYLPRGITRLLRYRIRFVRRGYFQIGPTVLETGDLMGLKQRYRIGAPPAFVLVYPKQIPLAGYDIASPRPIGEIRIRNAMIEDPTRIRGIRRWQLGDPLRSVHWPATARTGTLHSKVYEPTTLAGVTIVLDLHRDSHPARDEPVRSDLAVTLAASIASAFYEMNQPIGLLSNGRDSADRIRSEGIAGDFRTRDEARSRAAMRSDDDRLRPVIENADRGPAHYRHLRRTLARLELSDGLSIGETLVHAQQRVAHDTTLLVILRRCDPMTAALLTGMRRRGWAVAAVINTHDINDFAADAGPLIAGGIETMHLRDDAVLPQLMQQAVLR